MILFIIFYQSPAKAFVKAEVSGIGVATFLYRHFAQFKCTGSAKLQPLEVIFTQ